MIEPRFLHALRKIHGRLRDSSVSWAVTGSLGMALQGMGLTVNDIDIQTDKEGAYEIERRLSDYVVEPVRFVESTKMRSHLGMLQMDGIKVEIMGDIQKLGPDNTWEAPAQVELHKRWVDLDGLELPVLSLEYEYEAYRMMGRTDKAKLIRRWLDTRQTP